MIDPQKILDGVDDERAKHYFAAIQAMTVAVAQDNRHALRDARILLEETMAETMGVGELIGADLTLRFAHATTRGVEFARPKQTLVPRVTFDEAVQDMVERTPKTIRRAAERTAERISQLYSEGRVVAFAKSAEAAVTKRVQQLIIESIKKGDSEVVAGRKIKLGVDAIRKRTREWSEGYARTVYRTNVNTAITAGRFRAARDPDVELILPCFRLDTAGDVDVRPNHEAAGGAVLRVGNRHWARIAPPLGYNCRCQVTPISTAELQRMGRLGRGGVIRESEVSRRAGPDPGFRHSGRPDLVAAGAVR